MTACAGSSYIIISYSFQSFPIHLRALVLFLGICLKKIEKIFVLVLFGIDDSSHFGAVILSVLFLQQTT